MKNWVNWGSGRSKFLASALLFAVPLLIGHSASAQTACGDTTCSKGFECHTETGVCPDLACVSETDCKPCTESTYSYCAPSACQLDTDCGEGMVCASYQRADCGEVAPSTPTPSCAPDERCPAPTPVNCTTTTVKECAYRWTLPCTDASDCGPGFACKEVQQCTCSGSGSTPRTKPASGTGASSGTAGAPGTSIEPAGPSAGGVAGAGSGAAGAGNNSASSGVGAGANAATPAPPPDPAPVCDCQPSGQNRCEMIQTACETDGDCLSGWSCHDNPSSTCWASSDGSSGCTPADPAKLCTPPGYYGRDVGVKTGEADTGTSTTPSTPAPGSLQTGNHAGNDMSADAADDVVKDRGCSLGGTSSRSGGELALFLAAAAALSTARRRRRAQ